MEKIVKNIALAAIFAGCLPAYGVRIGLSSKSGQKPTTTQVTNTPKAAPENLFNSLVTWVPIVLNLGINGANAFLQWRDKKNKNAGVHALLTAERALNPLVTHLTAYDKNPSAVVATLPFSSALSLLGRVFGTVKPNQVDHETGTVTEFPTHGKAVCDHFADVAAKAEFIFAWGPVAYNIGKSWLYGEKAETPQN